MSGVHGKNRKPAGKIRRKRAKEILLSRKRKSFPGRAELRRKYSPGKIPGTKEAKKPRKQREASR